MQLFSIVSSQIHSYLCTKTNNKLVANSRVSMQIVGEFMQSQQTCLFCEHVIYVFQCEN